MFLFGRKGSYSVTMSSEEKVSFLDKVIHELDEAERGEGGRFSRMSPSKRAVQIRQDLPPTNLNLGAEERPSRCRNILRKVMVLFTASTIFSLPLLPLFFLHGAYYAFPICLLVLA